MARVPMVTRTVKATHCVCLAVDTVQGVVKEIEVTVPRTHKDDKLLKIVKEKFDTEEQIIVSVKSYEVVEQLYGISEDEFIKVAKPLDKR